MPNDVVSLRREGAGPLPRLAAERARAAAPDGAPADLADALQVARDLGPWVPLPMQGDTLTLWESLASIGAVHLTIAQVVEPHLDALSILREARRDERIRDEDWHRHSPDWSAAGLWQVYAADGSDRVIAAPGEEGTWELTGTKPMCSRVDHASHALVTAWVDDTRSALFAIDLSHPAVHPTVGSAAPAATPLPDAAITFDGLPAIPIGEPHWYLTRPGFVWSGVGVAATWYGAAVALARTLHSADELREPDQVALIHLGAVDTALARARAVLAEAAAVADDAGTTPDEAGVASQRARQVVADTAEEVMARVGRVLAPEEDRDRRIADLTAHIRRHHRERDLAVLGALVLGREAVEDPAGWTWW